MTPFARLIGLLLPACGATGARGLPTPSPLDLGHLQRPASPNTAFAAPGGTAPSPDIVTPTFGVPAARLYKAVIAAAVGQPRTFLAAAYPAERQAHFVVRSAVLNFPDLVTAQVDEAGPDTSSLVLYLAKRVWLFGLGCESPAFERVACSVAVQDQPHRHEIVADARSPIIPARRLASGQTLLSLRGEVVRLGPAAVDPGATAAAGRHDGDPELLEPRVLQFAAGQGLCCFLGLLLLYRQTPRGFMPGFCEIAAVYIVVAVYRIYLNQWLHIRWRRWLTERFLDEWLAGHAYWRISLTADRAAIGTDNPDQRIADDIRDFVDHTMTLSLSLSLQRRLAVQLRRHPVGTVRPAHAPRLTDPRLHGLARTRLRGRSARR